MMPGCLLLPSELLYNHRVPELPDIRVYTELLTRRVVGHTLRRVSIRSPFLLRTFEPPIESAEGRRVSSVSRLGKRVVFEIEGDLFLVLHLMIAGRLLWKPASTASSNKPDVKPSVKPTGKIDLAAFTFDDGTLLLTEAGTTKRASLHVLSGRDALAAHHRPGLDVLTANANAFAAALRSQSRTLKRALTDPRILDGIGNAYSDEILHAARLGPLKLTSSLTDEELNRLFNAARATLETWTDRLRHEFELDRPGPGRFPTAGQITAFRPDFAVHGKYRQPCPVCASPVQRIVHAENQVNYCATCQTNGKILADRAMSQLLKKDWPRTIAEWEELHGA